MKHILILFTFLFLLNACTSETSNTGTTEDPGADKVQGVASSDQTQVDKSSTDSTDFKTAFNNFFQALQTADTATINQFIHPDYGLWFIEQPGAVPKMTFVTDIKDFEREYQNRSFFTVAEEMEACDLQEESFPNFDCADMEGGKSGYSKDGYFVWTPEKFQKSGYWNYASLPMQDIKRIQTTLPRVQKSVLHTNTSFEFHFGYIQGHWRLLFAKLIYPCSA